MQRVVVIGARRRRQGIGEFVAQYFAECGAEICGLVGTSPETVEQAVHSLTNKVALAHPR